MAWIVSELFELMLDRGDREEARRLVVESAANLPANEPGSRSIPLRLEALLALEDGDGQRALERSLQVLELERTRPNSNVVAAQVWFVGRVFGPEAVGGPGPVEEARQRLEAVHWLQSLEYPDRVLERVRR